MHPTGVAGSLWQVNAELLGLQSQLLGSRSPAGGHGQCAECYAALARKLAKEFESSLTATIRLIVGGAAPACGAAADGTLFAVITEAYLQARRRGISMTSGH